MASRLRPAGAPVDFAVSRDVAFDYLADPRNRPAWQASLRRVERIEGDVGVGQRWVDVTLPGLRPAMTTVVCDRPVRWAERGTWHGIEAEGALVFEETATGCRVQLEVALHGHGAWRALGPPLTLAAVVGTRPDLVRAARLLSAPGASH